MPLVGLGSLTRDQTHAPRSENTRVLSTGLPWNSLYCLFIKPHSPVSAQGIPQSTVWIPDSPGHSDHLRGSSLTLSRTHTSLTPQETAPIALLWDRNENKPLPVLWPLLSFPNLLAYWVQHFTASSFRIWNSSAGIPSPPLALFVVMLHKAHLTSHSRMSD